MFIVFLNKYDNPYKQFNFLFIFTLVIKVVIKRAVSIKWYSDKCI